MRVGVHTIDDLKCNPYCIARPTAVITVDAGCGERHGHQPLAWQIIGLIVIGRPRAASVLQVYAAIAIIVDAMPTLQVRLRADGRGVVLDEGLNLGEGRLEAKVIGKAALPRRAAGGPSR